MFIEQGKCIILQKLRIENRVTPPYPRGGNWDKRILQHETLWIERLDAMIPPGLNEVNSYRPFIWASWVWWVYMCMCVYYMYIHISMLSLFLASLQFCRSVFPSFLFFIAILYFNLYVYLSLQVTCGGSELNHDSNLLCLCYNNMFICYVTGLASIFNVFIRCIIVWSVWYCPICAPLAWNTYSISANLT